MKGHQLLFHIYLFGTTVRQLDLFTKKSIDSNRISIFATEIH